MRQQRGFVSDGHAFADYSAGSDVGVPADDGGGMNDGGGVDSGRVVRLAVEELDGLGEGEIRIRGAQGRSGNLGEVRCDKDGGSVCGPRQRGVAWIGDESEVFR